jgi:hypothetical protein
MATHEGDLGKNYYCYYHYYYYYYYYYASHGFLMAMTVGRTPLDE